MDRSSLSWRHCQRRLIWLLEPENFTQTLGQLSHKIELDNARSGFLDYPDFLKLLAALPEYLQDPVSFLYHSGWRVSEMRKIERLYLDATTLVLPPSAEQKQVRQKSTA